MKKNNYILPFVTLMLTLGSCSVKDNVTEDLQTEIVNVKNYNTPVVWSEDMETLVLGPIMDDGDMSAIGTGFSNITDQLTSDTKVLIVDAIKDEYKEAISAVLYDNQGFVFINSPKKENIQEYEDILPITSDQFDYQNLDMVGICMEGGIFTNYVVEDKDLNVQSSEDKEIAKQKTSGDIVKEVINYPAINAYNPVYDTEEWFSFKDATEWMDMVLEGRLASSQEAQSRRADEKEAGEKSVKDITTVQGIPYVTNFKINYSFNYDGKIIRTCYIMGEAKYSVRPFYIYEGQASQGDYYVVEARYEWNNSSSFCGGEFNWDGWNALGACPEYCEFLTTPVMNDGYTCLIPVEGSVKPENVNKETKVDEERSFSLSAKGTFGGSFDKKGKKKKMGLNAGGEVCAEWGWKTSKSYTQNTWDIYRVGGGNQAGHMFVLNQADRPIRRTGWFRAGYDNVKHELLGSTFDVNSSWIWHVPETTMDSEEAPLTIKCEFKPHYVFFLNGLSSSFESRPDFFRDLPNLFTHFIKLQPTNRTNAGVLELKNTFENFTIANIQIYDATTNALILESDATTVEKGSSIKFTLPATNRKYNITFKAGTTDANSKPYKNTSVITLAGKGDVTSISTAYAFEEVKK